MRQDVMDHYGIIKEFTNAGFHETEQHRQLQREAKGAMLQGKFVVMAGIVGCGKTTILSHLQQHFEVEGNILVAKSLSVDKERVSLPILLQALFCDLSTDKAEMFPAQAERRERALRELIRKRKKPVVLFIDDAHDLQSRTLVRLKLLMEVVRDGGGILSFLLAGHPKLKNELRRATMEEIGNRATVFSLDNIHGDNREYIHWLLEQCTESRRAASAPFDDDAIDLLAERLRTPLQINEYLALALEAGFQAGIRPVTRDVIESVLARDINDIEPRLVRQGYPSKVLGNLLNIKTGEIRRFLDGKLAPGARRSCRRRCSRPACRCNRFS